MTAPTRGKRKQQIFPILEHPGDRPGIIDPAKLYARKKRVPQRCVLCFFHDVIKHHEQAGRLTKIDELPGEGEPIVVYATDDGASSVTVAWPGLGAPFAAATLEELIGHGVDRVICCGGAGALDSSIDAGTVIIPTAALRHEGTSYHYQRRGRWSRPHSAALSALKATCRARDIKFLEGRVWTTDAVFRETPEMVKKRRHEGCLAVEMEAAALFAVAKFRNVVFGQLLYAGDDVGGSEWQHRGWTDLRETRQGLFELALAACREMEGPHLL